MTNFLRYKNGYYPMKQAVEEARQDPTVHLIDVRTREEYLAGHLADSILLPLGDVYNLEDDVPNKEDTIYVYCRSGARSAQACQIFEEMGYQHVTNIGGILDWEGPLQRG